MNRIAHLILLISMVISCQYQAIAQESFLNVGFEFTPAINVAKSVSTHNFVTTNPGLGIKPGVGFITNCHLSNLFLLSGYVNVHAKAVNINQTEFNNLFANGSFVKYQYVNTAYQAGLMVGYTNRLSKNITYKLMCGINLERNQFTTFKYSYSFSGTSSFADSIAFFAIATPTDNEIGKNIYGQNLVVDVSAARKIKN